MFIFPDDTIRPYYSATQKLPQCQHLRVKYRSMNQTVTPSKSLPVNSFWELVDAALVINLDHRTDRWDKVRAHLKDIVPEEKLHRVSAVLGKKIAGYQTSHWFKRTKRPETWAGRAGCSVSHRNAMRLALDRGWNWVLMVEDDAQFVRGFDDEHGLQLTEFLQTRGDTFGFIYLGFDSPKAPIRCICSIEPKHRIYQIGGASTTHAYLINQTVMRRLLDEFPQTDDDIWSWTARNVVIDRWYSLNLHRWTNVAAVSPQLAIQEPSFSDITQRASDFCEDPDVDSLEPLASCDAVWKFSALMRAATRPLTMIPRSIKSLIRHRLGL